MKISGFSMVRNGDLLYYPVKQSIASILPIVDEFVIALGQGDPEDKTRELIESIGSSKIRIIDTTWDLEKYPNGTENAHQTDLAKNQCSGDWLFYLQADEVIHEKDLPTIEKRCAALLSKKQIDGLLFNYKHFWGDYDHYNWSHHWYDKEIRIVRNDPEIHSWESAQSFRRIPGFDGKNYRQQKGTQKLKVAQVDATVYHYGWVRPPSLMISKKKALDTIHKGEKELQKKQSNYQKPFDYGPLNQLPLFKGSHPKVMEAWIKKFDWKEQLQYSGKPDSNRPVQKHERLKYRMLTWIEQKLLRGKRIGGFKNYILHKI